MPLSPDVSRADQLAKRRALTCLALSLVLFFAQGASLDLTPDNPLPQFRSEAFYLWVATLVLLLILATGRLSGRHVRALANDEATIDHRRRALGVGFWAGLVACILFWTNTEDIPGAVASRVIMSVAVSAALLRFGWLEWKSLR